MSLSTQSGPAPHHFSSAALPDALAGEESSLSFSASPMCDASARDLCPIEATDIPAVLMSLQCARHHHLSSQQVEIC